MRHSLSLSLKFGKQLAGHTHPKLIFNFDAGFTITLSPLPTKCWCRSKLLVVMTMGGS
jgi:hypothetical protein